MDAASRSQSDHDQELHTCRILILLGHHHHLYLLIRFLHISPPVPYSLRRSGRILSHLQCPGKNVSAWSEISNIPRKLDAEIISDVAEYFDSGSPIVHTYHFTVTDTRRQVDYGVLSVVLLRLVESIF